MIFKVTNVAQPKRTSRGGKSVKAAIQREQSKARFQTAERKQARQVTCYLSTQRETCVPPRSPRAMMPLDQRTSPRSPIIQ